MLQVKFNEAVNKVVQAKDKVIDELRKKEQEMDEEVKVTKGQLETYKYVLKRVSFGRTETRVCIFPGPD